MLGIECGASQRNIVALQWHGHVAAHGGNAQ
jgi:hypothetical protein